MTFVANAFPLHSRFGEQDELHRSSQAFYRHFTNGGNNGAPLEPVKGTFQFQGGLQGIEMKNVLTRLEPLSHSFGIVKVKSRTRRENEIVVPVSAGMSRYHRIRRLDRHRLVKRQVDAASKEVGYVSQQPVLSVQTERECEQAGLVQVFSASLHNRNMGFVGSKCFSETVGYHDPARAATENDYSFGPAHPM
jgi:hypothetical protein